MNICLLPWALVKKNISARLDQDNKFRYASIEKIDNLWLWEVWNPNKINCISGFKHTEDLAKQEADLQLKTLNFLFIDHKMKVLL